MTQSHAGPRLPRWLKRNIPSGDAGQATARLVADLRLATVCEHARCPNRMECYAEKTATFMILGNVCTRSCQFCGVTKGSPVPVDPDEPRRVAEAAARLGLKHVVVTCVSRDDLPDGGAAHFAATIRELRSAVSATIEVLPSDFGGNRAAVDAVVDARPDVYNHNAETVPRLFPVARSPQSSFRWTLEMFRRIAARDPAIRLKTGIMLGLGETLEELLEALADLREAGCAWLTLGQYLQPAPGCVPVARYWRPEEFDSIAEAARRIGFSEVAAGPFVRSSYHAARMLTP